MSKPLSDSDYARFVQFVQDWLKVNPPHVDSIDNAFVTAAANMFGWPLTPIPTGAKSQALAQELKRMVDGKLLARARIGVPGKGPGKPNWLFRYSIPTADAVSVQPSDSKSAEPEPAPGAPTGFTCACGQFHKFPKGSSPREILVEICGKCGRRWSVIGTTVALIKHHLTQKVRRARRTHASYREGHPDAPAQQHPRRTAQAAQPVAEVSPEPATGGLIRDHLEPIEQCAEHCAVGGCEVSAPAPSAPAREDAPGADLESPLNILVESK